MAIAAATGAAADVPAKSVKPGQFEFTVASVFKVNEGDLRKNRIRQALQIIS